MEGKGPPVPAIGSCLRDGGTSKVIGIESGSKVGGGNVSNLEEMNELHQDNEERRY